MVLGVTRRARNQGLMRNISQQSASQTKLLSSTLRTQSSQCATKHQAIATDTVLEASLGYLAGPEMSVSTIERMKTGGG